MTTMLLLLLSGVLIGTGVSLIWRDVHSKRRDAFVLSRDPKADPELEPDVEITVSRPAASVPLCRAGAGRGASTATLAEQPAAQDRQRRRAAADEPPPATNRCCVPMRHAHRQPRSSGRRCSP